MIQKHMYMDLASDKEGITDYGKEGLFNKWDVTD